MTEYYFTHCMCYFSQASGGSFGKAFRTVSWKSSVMSEATLTLAFLVRILTGSFVGSQNGSGWEWPLEVI